MIVEKACMYAFRSTQKSRPTCVRVIKLPPKYDFLNKDVTDENIDVLAGTDVEAAGLAPTSCNVSNLNHSIYHSRLGRNIRATAVAVAVVSEGSLVFLRPLD